MNFYKHLIILLSLLLTSCYYTGRNTYEFRYKNGNDFLLEKNRTVVVSYTHRNRKIWRVARDNNPAAAAKKYSQPFSEIAETLIRQHWKDAVKEVKIAGKSLKQKEAGYLFEVVNIHCHELYDLNSFQINIKDLKSGRTLLSFSWVPRSKGVRDFEDNLSWIFENDLVPQRVFKNPV